MGASLSLHHLCGSVKHWVLDTAHPTPLKLRVFAGTPGSVDRLILCEVLSHVDIPGLEQCCDDDDMRTPTVWTESGACGVTGTMAVCRYIARLWRLYPVNPENALAVDGILEKLQSFCRDLTALEEEEEEEIESIIEAHLDILECHLCNLVQDRIDGDDETLPSIPWMSGLDGLTVADIAWAGCLDWVEHTLGQHGKSLAMPALVGAGRKGYRGRASRAGSDIPEEGEIHKQE